jgi:hypothetical protein
MLLKISACNFFEISDLKSVVHTMVEIIPLLIIWYFFHCTSTSVEYRISIKVKVACKTFWFLNKYKCVHRIISAN